jgi:putative membrane protein
MESTFKIKTAALQLIFASSIIFGSASCEHKEKDHTALEDTTKAVTKEVAKDQNDGKFNKNDDEKNAAFLVKATEINLEEINLGKLAQKKSTNKDVKELGKMMETAHTKALADLQKLAAKKSISIPTELTQDAKNAHEKLDGKSEKDFNKDYADKMVSGHKDAIDLFEKESTESSDEDIRTWATTMLPELRAHLDHAIAVQEKLSK